MYRNLFLTIASLTLVACAPKPSGELESLRLENSQLHAQVEQLKKSNRSLNEYVFKLNNQAPPKSTLELFKQVDTLASAASNIVNAYATKHGDRDSGSYDYCESLKLDKPATDRGSIPPWLINACAIVLYGQEY